MTSAGAMPAVQAAPRYGDSAAWALLVAGVSGALAAAYLAFVPATVSDDQFSHPLDSGAFALLQVFFFAHHLALAWGLYAVWQRGFAGGRRAARIGGPLSVAAMTLLGVHELVAISAADAAYPSPRTDVIETVYGALSMLNGAALVALGVGVATARLWSGWRRWVTLAAGVYVFVPMTPMIFGPFVMARLAIGGWMLLFAALGWALLRPDTGQRPPRDRTAASR